MESTGEFDTARALADRLLEFARNEPQLRRDLLLVSSMLATKGHDTARGLDDAKQAVALSREHDDATQLGEALSYLSNAQLSAGDATGAIATGEEQLALRIRQYGPKHVFVSSAHATLSRAYRRAHDLDAADRHIRAALDIDEAVLPPVDWRRSRHLNALMALRIEQRDFRTALDVASQCLPIYRVAYGDDNVEVTNDLTAVAALNLLLEDYAAALKPLEEIIARTDGKPLTGRSDRSNPHFKHAVALANTGHYEAGVMELRRALDDTPKTSASDLTDGYLPLAQLQIDHGDAAAALPTLDALDAATTAAKDDEAHERAIVLRARAYLALGRAVDARDVLDRAPDFTDPVAAVEALLVRAVVATKLNDSSRDAAVRAFAKLKALRSPPSRLMRLADALHRQLGDDVMM